MGLSNNGDADADGVEATITLPAGLTFAAPSAVDGGSGSSVFPHHRLASYMRFALEGSFSIGDWDCTLSDDALAATCQLPALVAGDTTSLDLELQVDADLAADAVTSFSVTSGEQSVSYSVATGLEDNEESIDDIYVTDGQVAAIHVGATLLGCDQTEPGCVGVMGGAGNSVQDNNNNDWAMQPINEAGGNVNSATTTLELPAGATVRYALLEWSANRSDGTDSDAADTLDGAMDSAHLRVPGASDYIPVTADSVKTHSVDGREYYRARLDITDLVAAEGSGDWSLADIALPTTMSDTNETYYGGFALTIVYEDSTLTNSRVAIFDGAQWVTSAESADVRFVTAGRADVSVGWTAWEGDRGLTGDTLDIDGTAFTPLRWNGNNTSVGDVKNAADSTAFGGQYANTLGVDAKLFRPAKVNEGVHTVTVSSSGDNFLLSTLTVTIVDEP
jgi:hypothetical protein